MLAINVNHQQPLLAFDISSIIDGSMSIQRSLSSVWTSYKMVGEIIDLSDYLVVDKDSMDTMEVLSLSIDDSIDRVKSIIDNHPFHPSSILTRLLLRRMLTLEFIITNKIADFYIEHPED